MIRDCAGVLGAVLWVLLAGCSADADRNRPGAGGASRGAGVAGGGGSAGSAGFGGFAGSTGAGGGAAGAAGNDPLSPITPMRIDDCGPTNPAGLSDADRANLMAGGAPGSLRLLYPYDATVFPRGLLAPMLMWDGGPAEFVYVRIAASKFEYKGCLVPTAAGQLLLAQNVWQSASQQTLGPSDPYTLELTVMSGGVASGPIAQTFTIAQATIKGSIYYNSYNSALPGGVGFGGSVLRIPPGGTAERFTSMECNGCHSVSVDGSRLLSQTLGAGGRSYLLAPNAPANPPSMNASARAAYGALYPDGSAYLATSTATEVARATLTAMGAPTPSSLFATDTGAPITGSAIPSAALMPSFSPDGSLLVFNDFAANAAHGLAIMNYDTARHSASGYRVLFMDTEMRPGWPFALPDNGAVVFTRTNGADFSGDGAGIGGLPGVTSSDLYIADIATGTTTILARAMGYHTPADAAASTTYLPFGASELHRSYFPTVSPVAAGGFFWVFFDALRHYGNLGLQRQLWGAAIAIAADGNYTTDRSYPAFYLPGQEFGTGNHRAFAALDPCKMDGDACTSGTDCCGGFCFVPESSTEFGEEAPGTCTADVPACAKLNERCTNTADCCPAEPGAPVHSCIAGYCALVPAIE